MPIQNMGIGLTYLHFKPQNGIESKEIDLIFQ